jgi:hypothetical protein
VGIHVYFWDKIKNIFFLRISENCNDLIHYILASTSNITVMSIYIIGLTSKVSVYNNWYYSRSM